MRVRAVFFDFGGTLAEQIADPIEVWLDLTSELRLPGNRGDTEQALETANDWFRTAVFGYYGRNEELWRHYDLRVLRALGIRSPHSSLTDAIQERFKGVRWNRAYDEAAAVLEDLRNRGLILHVISNATDEIRDRVREVGLAAYFDGITSSQEAGANKPDLAPFRLALQKTGCAAGDAIHVGNTYEEDVLGARRAGIAPIFVDRAGSKPEVDCPRVRDLTGVLSLLS